MYGANWWNILLPGINYRFANKWSYESLELRRLHADLIMCYKIVFGLVNLSFSDFFAFSPSTVTRGHKYKIYVNHSRGAWKYFFAERVVGPWNSLSTDTDFGTLKRFKLSMKSIDFQKISTHWVLIWWCCTLNCVYYYYFIFEANVSAILAFSFSLQFTTVLLYCYVHFGVTVSWNKLKRLKHTTLAHQTWLIQQLTSLITGCYTSIDQL